jgi:hypothetical protein
VWTLLHRLFRYQGFDDHRRHKGRLQATMIADTPTPLSPHIIAKVYMNVVFINIFVDTSPPPLYPST